MRLPFSLAFGVQRFEYFSKKNPKTATPAFCVENVPNLPQRGQ
jgi:hypothetical protein